MNSSRTYNYLKECWKSHLDNNHVRTVGLNHELYSFGQDAFAAYNVFYMLKTTEETSRISGEFPKCLGDIFLWYTVFTNRQGTDSASIYCTS